MFWFLFIQDTNGHRRFVGSPFKFDLKSDAVALRDAIEDVHNKPHKVDYWIVSAQSLAECKSIYRVD